MHWTERLPLEPHGACPNDSVELREILRYVGFALREVTRLAHMDAREPCEA
jgi:hypothetical protein